MKRCPQCSQSYNDQIDFCVDDGSRLNFYNSIVSADIPTQVLPPVIVKNSPSSEPGKLIYVAVGIMATLIVALIAVLMYMSSGSKDAASNVKQAPQASIKPETRTPIAANNTAPPDQPSIPSITETEARGLIERWVKAQNEKKFGSYSACYSQTFVGKKRTTDSVREMRYMAWMNDRRASMPNVVNVQAEYLNISIEGDNTATVKFVQHWRSVNHCDVGNKTMVIRMFADGPKIIFEDLENVQNCA